MATIPANTVQTFNTVGIREDLSDIITNISPTETPLYSMGRKGVTSNNGPEWQRDTLRDADEANAAQQGDISTANTFQVPERLRNWVQLFDEEVRVSTSAQASDTAGRASELKYHVAKAGKAIKTDIEKRACGNYPSRAPGAMADPNAAGLMGGLVAWVGNDGGDGKPATAINVMTVNGFDGTNVVAHVAGANADPVEDTHLKPMIAAVWARGGDPSVILVNATLKQDISSNFTGIATQYKENTGRSLSRAVILGAADWYVSDFGEHRVIPDRFADDTVITLVDPRLIEFKFLQPFRTVALAKDGHADRRLLSAELTLCVKEPDGMGIAMGMVPA